MKAAAMRVAPGLPVRLSVNQTDASYDAKAAGLSERIDVLIDGTVLDEVASYDVERGFVTRKARDSRGRVVLGERGLPNYERLEGVVEVRWATGDAA